MYDYVVIGAGSSGAVLASRLSEQPDVSVLLIEAGPDFADLSALPSELRVGLASGVDPTTESFTWGYAAQASRHQRPLPFPQGKVTGGSSAINGQMFVRALREDFNDWVGLGNDRWNFENVLPYYRRLETDLDFDDEWHGRDGPVAVHRYPQQAWLPPQTAFYASCRDRGFEHAADQNAPVCQGVGPVPLNSVGGVRMSTAATHLASARRRSNLTIQSGTRVRRLLIVNDRVESVEIESAGRCESIGGGQFVLTAGAIGSPHLLMLSGVGCTLQLAAAGIRTEVELPGVGSNLGDHPIVDVAWDTAVDGSVGVASPAIQLQLRYSSEGSNTPNDMKIFMRNRFVSGANATAPIGTRIGMSATVDRPVGTGSVQLVTDAPESPPRIELRHLDAAEDRVRMRAAVRLCLELATHRAFRKLSVSLVSPLSMVAESDEALDRWMLSNVKTSHHPTGTCKMGPEHDPAAVVDQGGRVHGLMNLRVADASIIPRSPRANPNSTVMMLGERIADMIANDQ